MLEAGAIDDGSFLDGFGHPLNLSPGILAVVDDDVDISPADADGVDFAIVLPKKLLVLLKVPIGADAFDEEIGPEDCGLRALVALGGAKGEGDDVLLFAHAGCRSLEYGNRFDFDIDAAGESGYGVGGAGGWVGREVATVDLVDGGEVLHAAEKDGGFGDVGEGESGGGEDGFEVGHDLSDLVFDVAADDVTVGLQRDLAAEEEELAAGADGLGIGPDGGGGVVGVDDGAAHRP